MKIRISLIFVTLVFIVAGCSLPKVTLFSEKGEPLKEYTLEGTGDDKVLVLSIDGVISDKPQKSLLRTRPSMVQQVATYLKHAEGDSSVRAGPHLHKAIREG